ncbi:hypothetical protein OCAR_4973 [Afipia carboxidovorans OM5]|nr:hypothetical protein OCAR_4973 [Afipia carboxidovorans OM5]
MQDAMPTISGRMNEVWAAELLTFSGTAPDDPAMAVYLKHF